MPKITAETRNKIRQDLRTFSRRGLLEILFDLRPNDENLYLQCEKNNQHVSNNQLIESLIERDWKC